MPGNDTSYRNVLIDLLPTQRGTAKLNPHFIQLLIGRTSKTAKARRWKSKDASVVQLKKDLPPLSPGAQRHSFGG